MSSDHAIRDLVLRARCSTAFCCLRVNLLTVKQRREAKSSGPSLKLSDLFLLTIFLILLLIWLRRN